MTTSQVMLSPLNVDIAVTGRCNLDCRYCFYADEMVARTDLPTESWLAFFNELGRLGVMNVTLTGGEVFTRRDLFELIDGLIANRMRYSLLTNGTLITEKIIERFMVGKRRTRLDSIQLSVDGSRAEVHNKSRPGSFDRVIRGLRLLKDAGFPLTVRVTVNRHNVDDLENIAHLLLDEIGLRSFTTNEANACGAANHAEAEITLTPQQRFQAMSKLAELAERYKGRISAQAGPLALQHALEDIEKAKSEGRTSIPGRGTLTACGGVFNKIAILHDGTIVPCHMLSTLRLGAIGEVDLRDVWLNSQTMIALRDRRQIPLSSLETCQDCTYQGFCTGGCPGGAVNFNDDVNSRDPMDCYRVLKGEDPFFSLDSGPINVDYNAATRSK